VRRPSRGAANPIWRDVCCVRAAHHRARSAPLARSRVLRRSAVGLVVRLPPPRAAPWGRPQVAPSGGRWVDDLTGDPADTTVTSALDEIEYEVDLRMRAQRKCETSFLGMLRLLGG
jgi:hypothetical protein